MGFPPSVQRYLGMMWMAQLLYPQEAQYNDLYGEVAEYFSLFYHSELTEDQYNTLVAIPSARRRRLSPRHNTTVYGKTVC